jgi:membrane protease subunit HflK
MQGPDLEDLLRQWRERFRMGGGGGASGGDGGRRGPVSWPVLLGILAIGWLTTGVYTVDEGERGVITVFGNYDRTTGPGLHWKLPQPISGLQIHNVTGQRTINIGFRAQGDNIVDNADESLMITGDRNLVEVRFRINYNIKDVFAYSFNINNPDDEVVRQVAESAMREVIGRRQLEAIITTERPAVEQEVEQLTQATLDEYLSGVQVLQIELLRAAAPQAVADAFYDVVNAGQDAETARNNANREAATIVNEAQGYRERVVREATGEAQRFTSVYNEYRQAPQVTRDRLYLETMERVYRNGNLIILDARGGAVPYFPLDGVTRRDAAPVQPGGGAR